MQRSAGGAASLHTLANLSQFHQEKPPKSHAFLLGTEGHWITLLLQIDAEGNKEWHCCDSHPDHSTNQRFQTAIALLDSVIDNPEPFIRENYRDAVGDEIKRKAAWCTPEGKIKGKQDLGTLLNSAPEFLKLLTRTYDFMERSGWLTANDREIQRHVKELKTYVKFYAEVLKIPIESNDVVREMCEGLHIVLHQETETEEEFEEPVVLTEEVIQAFKNMGDPGPAAIVSKATAHYYLAQDAITPTENLQDYGWGCAWRSIKTVLSAFSVPDMPVKELFNNFKKGWPLVQAYKKIHPELSRFQRKKILTAAPEKWGNRAEPFIGQLALAELGIKSRLELYRRQNSSFKFRVSIR